MTIYDVPVDDTVFFPVSGDMMRQMKHDEELRAKAEAERRDRIIRDKLAQHRADHLINLLHKENDTGDSAKNPPDAVEPNTQKGERNTMFSIAEPATPVHTDGQVHPIWCDPEACTEPLIPGDFTMHRREVGTVEGSGRGFEAEVTQPDDQDPHVFIHGEAELNLQQVDQLITLLVTARQRLIDTGEVR